MVGMYSSNILWVFCHWKVGKGVSGLRSLRISSLVIKRDTTVISFGAPPTFYSTGLAEKHTDEMRVSVFLGLSMNRSAFIKKS